MDPHKRSATIEAMADDEEVLGRGRFETDAAGFEAMLAEAQQWPDRVWAVEGCEGIGKHLVLRLLDRGEPVVDVPAKLSARMRVYATGQGRKTDDTDAHAIALVAVRMTGLREVVNNETLEVLRLLVDRRRRIGEDHTRSGQDRHRGVLCRTAAGRPAPRPDLARIGQCSPRDRCMTSLFVTRRRAGGSTAGTGPKRGPNPGPSALADLRGPPLPAILPTGQAWKE
jgi:transposase